MRALRDTLFLTFVFGYCALVVYARWLEAGLL